MPGLRSSRGVHRTGSSWVHWWPYWTRRLDDALASRLGNYRGLSALAMSCLVQSVDERAVGGGSRGQAARQTILSRRRNVIQPVTVNVSCAKPVPATIYAGLTDFAIPQNVTDSPVKSVTRARESRCYGPALLSPP